MARQNPKTTTRLAERQLVKPYRRNAEGVSTMKKQSKKQIADLMRQFPAIARIHNEVVRGTPNPEVKIRVQRADPSFMYWEADNVEGDRHHLVREGGDEGTRYEHAYVLDVDGDILKKVSWQQFGDYKPIRDIFLKRPHFHPSHVGAILVVTRYDWYKKPPGAYERSGGLAAHMGAEIYYTIHQSPDAGFEWLIKTTDLSKNVELTERLLTQGMLKDLPEFQEAFNKLMRLASTFERRVYNTGLKEIIDASKKKGMSGAFGEVSLMSWVMCGRIMMTFEANNLQNPQIKDTFTIIGNNPPEEARFGFRSIYATADRATEMVEKVLKGWEETTETDRVKLYRDSESVKLDVLAAMG